MPGPVSLTERLYDPSTAAALIVTSPWSVNLIALPTRFSSTWGMRRSSPPPAGTSLGPPPPPDPPPPLVGELGPVGHQNEPALGEAALVAPAGRQVLGPLDLECNV